MNISLSEQVRVYPKGEVLFREGDKATHMLLVKSGRILCLKSSKDRLIPVQHASAQSIVGEEAVLTNSQHQYSAVCLDEVEVVEIDAQLIRGSLNAAPHWIKSLLTTLGERLNETAAAISEHRIISTDLSGGSELPPEEENRLRKLLDQ
ncbi:MAG: Crp/Fnr family transcriptional regulator [Bacteriovoracia bacterium]